ncbi:MAG: isocitrate/isopropylmalate dehydrogenase family protein [Thermoplasmata archaeon]|jgi:3-isopropylmalate dehydrogenase
MEFMVLKGDGIGPEVMESALNIINIFNTNFFLKLEPISYDINARTLKQGKWNIDKVLEEAKKFKCILKAPMGDPDIRNVEGTEAGLDIILSLRFKLDLFANVRPVRLFPGVISPLRKFEKPFSIDYVILRENSEGLYSSHFGGLNLRDELAIDIQTITKMGAERIAEIAVDLTKKSNGRPLDGKKVLTIVDKSNVLKSFAFFRKVVSNYASKYNDIELSYMYADAMEQEMVLHPERLNVIVTENMFGDLLSDLGAATVGGLGMAYSANLSKDRGMFEPVHGSANDIAGKNIANPVAMLMSLSLMLDWLDFKDYAKKLENSIISALKDGIKTVDLGGNYSTKSFTDEIIKRLLEM